jgi:hypothetical protein
MVYGRAYEWVWRVFEAELGRRAVGDAYGYLRWGLWEGPVGGACGRGLWEGPVGKCLLTLPTGHYIGLPQATI